MDTRITRGIVFVLSGLCLADAHPGAQQSGSEQLPSFRSGVELVTVEVGVVDRDGRPLPDLKPSDFKVTVADQPRRVVTAEYIDVGAERASAARADALPVSTNEGGSIGRLVVFVVDANTLEMGDARHVANAASRFFSGLTPADRSALVSLPIGRRIAFTWAHERVRAALLQAASAGGIAPTWEFGSLSEARDIVTRGAYALRDVASRECSGSTSTLAGGIGVDPSGPPVPGSGQSLPSGGNPTGGAGQGTRPTPGSSQPVAGPPPGAGDWAMDRCVREIQSQAELAWNMARTNSLASLASLRDVLATLRAVQGDKTVILISGGWPMDEHDEMSMVRALAEDAAAARATVFSLYVPRPIMSASRRSISLWSRTDQNLYRWPLENFSSMTGGRSYTTDADMEAVFGRLSRELAGYYRIGVEKSATDVGASGRRMKVDVSRNGATVRARGIFDVATYEDRDWSARLASAVDSPIAATAVGLRVTSYLAADAEDPSFVRLLLAGNASRLQPGDATLQVVVRDLQGRRVVGGDQRMGEPNGGAVAFATNVRVPQGSYVVRVAVQDGAGRVGSVDHRVEARPVPVGPISVTGPILVEVAADGHGEPHFTIDGVRSDERLAFELRLSGDSAQLASADVTFEIAASAEGPALIQQAATLSPAGSDRAMLAQAMADIRLLPPGRYLARVKVSADNGAVGEVHRPFEVLERLGTTLGSAAPSTDTAATSGSIPGALVRGGALGVLPRFAVRGVLAPRVLDGFLDKVAARPDAAFPGNGELLGRARTADVAELSVSEAQAAQTPVAAFVRGLALLAQNKLNPAAASFRSAMRASPDFYPAMVYLGACYAAGGNDKEAAAVWRTALIKEGAEPAVHLLLADALLRQGQGDLALQVVTAAGARWPDNDDLKRRFVQASLLAGHSEAGLQALDDLVKRGADDEPSLALGLLTLYEALSSGRAIANPEQDRAQLMHLAGVYRGRGGPSLALVDTWVAAVKEGGPKKPD